MHARSLGQRVRRPGVKGGSGRPRLNIDGVSASCRRSSIRCRVLVMVLLAAAFQPARATAATLPPEVVAALARGKLPTESVSIVVREVASADGGLAWRAGTAANPASLMKLVTTYAALDLLGPAWTWSTAVWLDGKLHNPGPKGVLDGDLVIRGSGDPKLVIERVWLLLRRVRQAGVKDIRGDIVLDSSAFDAEAQAPADFDGEPLRPYNARPEALMFNFKSLLLAFVPDPARGVARILAEPPLAGVRVDATVPLGSGPCDNWRGALKLDAADPQRVHFAGVYAASCGEQTWPMAYAEPSTYGARLIGAMWREAGGELAGKVRDGRAPRGIAPSFEFSSPPLVEVVRDINKYSNNLMAGQLFLTLGLQFKGSGSASAARDVIQSWLRGKLGERAADVLIDSGSGLSRESRVSAEALAQLLQRAWASPVMPEFVASLPIRGVDGTQRRAPQSVNGGSAHLKTGSLRDVAAVAGYLLAPGGRRYVLVAIVNHPNADAARPALDALVDWALSAQGQAALRE
jgi:serine-type D-Ala-D-Ala carboxypeptidase/endopeptidase (penicillin-binding protein 4)